MQIRQVDLNAQNAGIRDEIGAAITGLLDDGRLVHGPQVALLEQRFAKWCGTERAIGCGSGTAAIHLALCALGVGHGDEVIVPAYAPIATVSPIAQTGACIVLADVDPETYTLDPRSVAEALSPRTRAIIAVHTHGQMADLGGLNDVVQRTGAYVDIIENAAHAPGAEQGGRRAGSVGRLGAFSFAPESNLGSLGEGGALTTNDASIGERARKLAHHGRNGGPRHDLPGFNYKLDTVQAVVLLVKLKQVERWNRQRQLTAALYDELLADTPGVRVPRVADGNTHVYRRYVIEVDDPEGLQAHLAGRGIESERQEPLAVLFDPALKHMHHRMGAVPVAQRLVPRLLSLPMHPELRADEVVRVVDAVREFQGAGVVVQA